MTAPAPVGHAWPKVTIYTDGGCQPNPGIGGWGARIMVPNHPIRELSGGHPTTTNNRMEMMAAVAALEDLAIPSDVVLVTDSQYLRQGITAWLPGWKRNGWRTSNGEPVKNRDLWERLDAATRPHRVAWRWVKGHAGDEHNERCDELATRARFNIASELSMLGVPRPED